MEISILDAIKIKISAEEIVWFLRELKKWIIEIFKKRNDPRILSLKNDILNIFDESLDKLQKYTDLVSDNQWKILLWISDNSSFKLDIDGLWEIIENKSNPFLVWVDNYMKHWEYRKVFSDLFIKLSAYWITLKECFDDYWTKKHTKELKRERKLLNDFFSENIEALKRWYVDFMAATFYPQLSNDERKYVVDKLWEKQYFEEYKPIIKDFLGKIENRLCR